MSTAVMSASRFEVGDGLIVWAQPCCDEVRQRSMGPTGVLMPWGSFPTTTQFPPGSPDHHQCTLRLVKFWTNIFEIDERDLKLKPLLSIRVAFLLPCRSIYIKRVKAGDRNELELNVEFGATINLWAEKAGNGKGGCKRRCIKVYQGGCKWRYMKSRGCFMPPLKSHRLFTGSLLKCRAVWRPQIASIILRSAYCPPGTTPEKGNTHLQTD